jgi:3-methyladenine DNA glycosylase Mpg
MKRNLTKLTYKMKSLELENYSGTLDPASHALRKLGG